MNAPKSASQINSGTILLAFVAIMVGLGGTYAMRVFTRKVEEVAKPPEKAKPVLTTVPLASRDILSGTELTLDDVALFKMTPEDIKKRFPGVSFMTNPSQIIGKIALNEIKQGQPFNTQDFFPLKKGPGVVKRLQPGLRALTLVLNKTDALLGFAGPGQRVDVLFNYGTDSAAGINKAGSKGIFFNHFLYNPPRVRDYRGNTIGGGAGSFEAGEAGLQGATTTLAQNVEILALGRQSAPTDAATALPDEEQVEVTLAVSPKQAELLRVADQHGELSLTLRGAADNEQLALVDPVTLDQIIDIKKNVHEMEVYRGTQVSRLQFSGGTMVEQRTFMQDPSAPVQQANRFPPLEHPDAVTAPPTFVPVLIPPDLWNQRAPDSSMQTLPVGTMGGARGAATNDARKVGP